MSDNTISFNRDDFDLSLGDHIAIDDLEAMAVTHTNDDLVSDASSSQQDRPGRTNPVREVRDGRRLHGEYSVVGGLDLSPLVSTSKSKQKATYKVVASYSNKWTNICRGLIGTEQNSFCLKDSHKCKSHREGGTHRSAKFEPSEDTFYICKNTASTAAWCKYSCAVEKIPDMFVYDEETKDEAGPTSNAMFSSAKHTLAEWKGIFHTANSRPDVGELSEEELKGVVNTFVNPDKLSLKTPTRSNKIDVSQLEQDLKVDVKKAFEFISSTEALGNVDNDADAVVNRLSHLTKTVKSLVQTMDSISDVLNKKVDRDIVSKDFLEISTALQGVRQEVGESLDTNFPNLWTAVENLAVKQQGIPVFDAVHEGVKTLQDQFVLLEGHQSVNEERWSQFAKNWIPVLVRHDKVVAKLSKTLTKLMSTKPSSGTTVNDLDKILRSTPSSFKAPSSIPRAAPSESHAIGIQENTEALRSEIVALKAKVQSYDNINDRISELEARARDTSLPIDRAQNPSDPMYPGAAGVAFKNIFFDSPDSVRLWIKENMQVPSHGLFVDILSYMEYFGGDRYIEKEETLREVYASTRIGFVTQFDSKNAASFQNTIPGAFGRRSVSSSGGSSVEVDFISELPGLPSFKEWDKRDGSTGRRYWLEKESRKTFIQIDNAIRQHLVGPAQLLALDLLSESRSMCDKLIIFISQQYEDIMNSGRFDTSQAWAMTCKFIKRIFAEISDVRVIARDGIHADDHISGSAKFIYATLKAQQVMARYMKANIKDHPSISSEMVKYICYSQPSSDAADILAKLNNLSTLQKGDQRNISKMEKRLATLESWKTEAEKTIKRLSSGSN